MAPTKIWHQDDNHAIANVGACIVSVWRGPHTLRNWRAESTPVCQACEAMSPQGILMMVVGEAAAGMPDATARRELDELSKARAKIIAATSVVIFGPSVRVATVRALATAVNIIGGSKMHVYTDVAVDWRPRAGRKSAQYRVRLACYANDGRTPAPRLNVGARCMQKALD